MENTIEYLGTVVAKSLTNAIYKKTGYKIDIQLDDLDISFIDGKTKISTNVDLTLNSKDFIKIIKTAGLD